MFKFNLSDLQVFLTLETDNPDKTIEIKYTGDRSKKEEVKEYIEQALEAQGFQAIPEQAKPIEIYYILKKISLTESFKYKIQEGKEKLLSFEIYNDKLTPDVVLYYRDQLRNARSIALKDAEGFQEILFVLERLGFHLKESEGDLSRYKCLVDIVARLSALSYEIPSHHSTWHLEFSKLYDLVREARNDALHQGAVARHLTNNAVQIALILEDALMENQNNNTSHTANDFMVRGPICAERWQPLSFIRQQMLTNSFTYLPVQPQEENPEEWKLISDFKLAKYLRGSSDDRDDRKTRLAYTLEQVEEDEVLTLPVKCYFPDTPIHEILNSSNEETEEKPVLVLDPVTKRLLGIITPFDLL